MIFLSFDSPRRTVSLYKGRFGDRGVKPGVRPSVPLNDPRAGLAAQKRISIVWGSNLTPLGRLIIERLAAGAPNRMRVVPDARAAYDELSRSVFISEGRTEYR